MRGVTGVTRATVAMTTALLIAALTQASGATAAGKGSAGARPGRLYDAGARPGVPGPPSAAAKKALAQGYLVPDQAAYNRAKAAADRRAGRVPTAPGAGAPSPLAPILGRSWQGVNDVNSAPSDSTGAIGTSRYVELVNRRFGIYNRNTTAAISTGTLNALAGASAFDNVFDPQIIWDGQTNRFFYAMDQIVSSTDHRLAFGFSKSASPNAAADWCKYFLGYGAEFPDYPKLGDTSNFALIGANVFTAAGNFLRTDLVSITKPSAGTTCPTASSFGVGIRQNLRSANGNVAWTPVPANQIDPSSTGWVMASRCCSGGFLSVFKVTRNANGTPNFGPARTLTVPSYATPASAPQATTNRRVDTLDSRLTQAVSAIDPSRGTGGQVAVWTQHTTLGGAGAEVRWYEVNPNPATPGLFQSGKRTSGSLFVFNGAVSPDRQVRGTTRRFGANMVLGFNTSSSSTFADIRALSKVGAGAQSADLIVKTSTGPLDDFSCNSSNVCRWGDYASATPDPNVVSTAANGQVWLTNQWVQATPCCAADWRSWNYAVSP